MKIENLEDLFNHTLEDIYFAETKLVKALPKMAKASDSPALAKAFMGHRGRDRKSRSHASNRYSKYSTARPRLRSARRSKASWKRARS